MLADYAEEPCDKCRRKQTKRAGTSGRFREEAHLYKLRYEGSRSAFGEHRLDSKKMYHLTLSLVLCVATLAQNCPNCGQNPTLIPSTTTPMPQTATAKIKIVLNTAPDSNNLQVQGISSSTSNCASGNCNSANAQVQAYPALSNAPVVSTTCTNGNCNQAAPIVVSASSGCSGGNCNSNAPIVVAAPSGCTTGNCNNAAPIVVAAPSGCISGNCNNAAPIILSAPSSGCISGNCGPQPIVIPAFNSGCSGIGCGVAPPPFFFPSPILNSYAPIISPILSQPSYGFGCGSSGCGYRSRNFGVPDPITTNGRFFRPRIRVPTSYNNGNPVFNVNSGYGKK